MKVYVFNGKHYESEEDVREAVELRYGEDSFDEFLDALYGSVEIVSMNFNASRILRELDPIAYRCAYDDYMDSIYWDNVSIEEVDNG